MRQHGANNLLTVHLNLISDSFLWFLVVVSSTILDNSHYPYQGSMQYLLDKLFINPRGRRNGESELSKSSINKNIKYKPTLCGCRLDQASSALALTTLDRMSLPAERATNRRKARRTLWITSFVSVLVCNKIFNERVQWSGDVWGYSSE